MRGPASIAELRRKTRMFSLKRLERRLEPVCREHLAMIDALSRGDTADAAARTAGHVDNIRASSFHPGQAVALVASHRTPAAVAAPVPSIAYPSKRG
ncbi:hypothetical protein [Cupriavidus malaysiensis]|uniref:FCD domain-containing protein n=1 Tax=Cupriavidus malaysiensis TaxID=367825 RepID=A0ABN4TM14_9BURK|nr:hypothetical protein [Cupriavidus malaysiensis]AOZ06240.1 hypothetical protein BKK80_10640 [Cupriavidus malaysiensis]